MPQISDYALLSNCHSAALVSRDGAVDWWCPARFDAPSVFGRLLDPSAGHFTVRPAVPCAVSRRYLPDTMVLETTFSCDEGELLVTDALALGPDERGHELGRDSRHVLVRRVEVVRGTLPVQVEVVPRPEYGLILPHVSRTVDGWELSGGADRLVLTATPDPGLEPAALGPAAGGPAGSVSGIVTLQAGQPVVLALAHRRSVEPVTGPFDAAQLLEDTVAGWRSWTALHSGYRGPYREQVMTSARVLQALTYRPTGAVVAAPTTSLPEEPGGAGQLGLPLRLAARRKSDPARPVDRGLLL